MRALCPLLLLLVAAHPARAVDLRGSFGLERRHDDNILRLSKSDLADFESDSGTSQNRIESTADWLTVLRGDLRLRAQPIARRTTSLTLSADAFAYDANHVKNWQQYALTLAQELTASRRALTLLRAWTEYEPLYYLREGTDVDASFAEQRIIRRSLVYAQTTGGARVVQTLLDGRLDLSAGAERIHRDYVSSFDERDNDNDQWAVGARVRPSRRSDASVGLEYLSGTLTARGDLDSTEIRDADVSYTHHGLAPSLTIPWPRGRLDAWWTPETRTYTTEDIYDQSRYGRVTHRREIGARLAQSVWRSFELTARVTRFTSDADYPLGVEADPEDNEAAQTVIGAGLRWHGRF